MQILKEIIFPILTFFIFYRAPRLPQNLNMNLLVKKLIDFLQKDFLKILLSLGEVRQVCLHFEMKFFWFFYKLSLSRKGNP